MSTNQHRAAALVVLLALFALLVVLFSQPADGAILESPADNWDSTCGTSTGTGRELVQHDCWTDAGVRWMRHWQPGMVGNDPTKPGYTLSFELPVASCTWWGINAHLYSADGEIDILGGENISFVVSERTVSTVSDPGGVSAGFDIWCSGVVGNVTPTPTSTPSPSPTPTPTATPGPVTLRSCTTPMMAFAGSPDDPQPVPMPVAYQPQVDPVWDGEVVDGIVIGQWSIGGQTPRSHWYCTRLPQGRWEVLNVSGSVEDATGEILLAGNGAFTLTGPSTIWIMTWDGARLQGPPWKVNLPSIRKAVPTTLATPDQEIGTGLQAP